MTASPLWKRLDTPGHDACVVERSSDGWRLRGLAAFAEGAGPAALAYEVACGADWITRHADVRGYRAGEPLHARFERSADGRWLSDDDEVAGLEGCLDIDFGFTPATNFLQLSREAMAVGDRRAFDVAWWEFGDLQRLPQTYERLSETTYQYDSPQDGYSAVLEIGRDGFVVHYPTLWAAEGHPAIR